MHSVQNFCKLPTYCCKLQWRVQGTLTVPVFLEGNIQSKEVMSFRHFYTFRCKCKYNTQFLECKLTTMFRSCSSLCFSHGQIYHCSTVESLWGLQRRCPDVAAPAGAVHTDPPSCSDHSRLIPRPVQLIITVLGAQNFIPCSHRALSLFFTSTSAQLLVHHHCW